MEGAFGGVLDREPDDGRRDGGHHDEADDAPREGAFWRGLDGHEESDEFTAEVDHDGEHRRDVHEHFEEEPTGLLVGTSAEKERAEREVAV